MSWEVFKQTSGLKITKKMETWNYKKHLAEQARYRREADGVFEACMSKLRKKGGPIWARNLCQADIIATIVLTTRAHDKVAK